MDITYTDIKKAVTKSQHCQRNWDLTKDIPQDHLELFEYVASQCPSKQNIAYYNIFFITQRDVINKIHENTTGFYIDGEFRTNSQVLANLLVVFAEKSHNKIVADTKQESFHRNAEIDQTILEEKFNPTIQRDADMAIGIAAGYLNLTASLLGYRTGCCACFNDEKISQIVNTNSVKLLMGIGYADAKKSRREHHLDSSVVFPTLKRQPIDVNYI